MVKKKFGKKLLGVIMATSLLATAVPLSNLVSAKADPGLVETTPLTTVWKTQELGTHVNKGSYSYDAASKKVTVNGAGTLFDKNAGKDDLFYTYFNAKGKISISAKVSFSNPNSNAGYAGIILRNVADDAGSTSAAIYADYANGAKNQIRYGYHKESTGGGASQLMGKTTPGVGEDLYLKIEVEQGKALFYASALSDFSDVTAAKAQPIDTLSAKTVGFFATDGITAEFSDVKITSVNTEDGITTNKIVFDSNIGEMIPELSNSATYGAKYTAATTFNSKAYGNILKVDAIADATDKGTIRENKNIDYLLFPKTTENYEITADLNISAISTSTDKVGFFLGEFAFDKAVVKFNTMQYSKNMAAYPHYTNAGETAGTSGEPKADKLQLNTGYTMKYKKSTTGIGVSLTDGSGKTLASSMELPNALSNYSSFLQSGSNVQYGLAFAGVTTELTNIKLIDEDGYVVYDQNDYYIAVGVAPEVTAITKTAVAEDRLSINLEWTATEGVGNTMFFVMVSKDGGAYEAAGTSKVNSFAYSPNGGGEYKFKVYGKSGDDSSLDTAKETAVISYKAPLAQTVLTTTSSASQITLNWTEVANATSYDVYRADSLDGEFKKLTGVSELTYVDKSVTKEEPYYYYIVALSGDNSSNPSDTQQVLATDGHVGQYVYEKNAVVFDVKSKSNDTVFASEASIVGVPDKAVNYVIKVNGTEQLSGKASPSARISANLTLVEGRNDVELLMTDADGKVTRNTFNFVSKPKVDIIVDGSYKGTDGAQVDGTPTYATIKAALAAVPADNSKQVVIFIKNGDYNERLEVKSPKISLLGEDSENTRIYYSAAVSEGTAKDMWTRNAVYVDSTADEFTAENLTIENSFNYTNGSDQQADALCIVADKTLCVNIRLIGYQDTLLTDSRVKDANGNYEVTRQHFYKCYITGNVDFIYGAGTSSFEDCDIVARYTEYKADGCFTAGRTYKTTSYGYVFNNCRFMAETGVADGAFRLARPWGADAATTFINCYMGSVVTSVGYGDMSGNSYKNARFSEYGTYGAGFAVNNDRPLLTSNEAKKFAASTVMGDFAYDTVMKDMYKAGVVDPSDKEVITDSSKLTEEVEKEIASSTETEITFKVSEDMVVSAKVFDSIKAAEKRLTLLVCDADGNCIAILSIDGKTITKSGVDFSVKLATSVNSESISKIFGDIGIGDDKLNVIDFEYTGELPGPMDVIINVGNKFADASTLALYYYNPTTGKVEYQNQALVEQGLVWFTINHCSQYVMVNASPDDINNALNKPTEPGTTAPEPGTTAPESDTSAPATENSTSAPENTSPATGDRVNVMLYLLLAAAGIAGITAGISIKRRKEN